MVPEVDIEHKKNEDYYNIDGLDLGKIKDKIKFFECKNIGISYGQFFTCLDKNRQFDYHIFIEDDYICFTDYFEDELIKNVKKNTILCSFYYKLKKWNIIDYSTQLAEEQCNIIKLKENFTNLNCSIPDFSLCIISKEIVNKIFNIYSIVSILQIFSIKLKNIWIHQIIFGYIIKMCDINIDDISKEYLNIFFHSSNKSISLCNEDNFVHNWKHMEIKKYKTPLFIPLEIILYNYDNDIKLMQEYLLDKDYFLERIKKLKNLLL